MARKKILIQPWWNSNCGKQNLCEITDGSVEERVWAQGCTCSSGRVWAGIVAPMGQARNAWKFWYWNPHGKRFFGICKVYGTIILKWAIQDATHLHIDPWPVAHRRPLCFLATLVRMCGKVLWEMQGKITCESTCTVGTVQSATIKSQEGRGAGNSLQHGGVTSFCRWSDNLGVVCVM